MANKLELTWVGKDEEIKLEPRILIENPTLSNIEKDKDTENMLIHITGSSFFEQHWIWRQFHGSR